MKKELIEAASAINSILLSVGEDEIVSSPMRFFGRICDSLFDSRYAEVKKLIKKGLDSGVYADILGKRDRMDEEVQRATLKLINSEFMTEGHAREIVGLFLLSLNNDSKSIAKIEKWVDECAIETPEETDVITTQKPDENKNTSTVVSEIEPLLKRMFLFLEEKNWTSAAKYAEMVLDKDPECFRAYLGKIMVDFKLTKEILLGEASTPQISINQNFKNACKFASTEELKKMKDYEYRNAYAHGKDVMGKAVTEKNFKDASTWFALYPDYKDSRKLFDECIEKAEIARKEAIYQNAPKLSLSERVKAYESISGYKDSSAKRKQVLEQIKYNNYAAEQKKEKEIRNLKIQVIVVAISVLIDVILTFALKNNGMGRWVWLPISSAVLLAVVPCIFMPKIDESRWGPDYLYDVISISLMVWLLIRSLLIVIAQFKFGAYGTFLTIIFSIVLVVLNAGIAGYLSQENYII